METKHGQDDWFSVLRSKIGEIELYLDGWHISSEEPYKSISMTNPKYLDAKIIFESISKSGNSRVVVSGCFPDNFLVYYCIPGGYSSLPYITFAIHRNAKTLAKEIQRRFIKRYLCLLQDIIEQKYAISKELDNRNGILKTIYLETKANSIRYYTPVENGAVMKYDYKHDYKFVAHVAPNRTGDLAINIDLERIPLNLAMKIFALLQTYYETPKTNTETIE